MSSYHYVYTKEGITDAIGLKSVSQINKYKRDAIKAGYIPSKTMGGTEYFDFDQITQFGHAENFLSNEIEKQIEGSEAEALQLKLVFK